MELGHKKSEKHRKKYDRAKSDYQAACADVARRHFPPNMFGSVFFVILLRILGIENSGKVSIMQTRVLLYIVVIDDLD